MLHERVGRGGAAAVVRHLEDVQRPARARDAGGQELRIDLLLDVTGEHQPSRAEGDIENDRDVVDGRAGIRWPQWHGPGQWPVNVDAHAVEHEDVACGNDPARATKLREAAAIGRVTRPRPDHARLDDLRNAVTVQDGRQSGDVVLVRMGHHHEI